MIGSYAIVVVSALVTKSVLPRALFVGNPARIVGWLNKDGMKMTEDNGLLKDKDGSIWFVKNDELIEK